MRRRWQAAEAEAIGTDSFLDIVANLVGILVILVMVIGVGAQDAWDAATAVDASIAPAPSVPEEVLPPLPDVQTPKAVVARMKASIIDADLQAARLEQQLSLQQLQRDQLLLALTQTRRKLDDRRHELDERQQARVDLGTQVREAQSRLFHLREQTESLEADQRQPDVIPHIATPLAQTVFAQEEHFRFTGGRITYVPVSALAARLKAEAPKKLWKLKDASRIVETIGPQDGFYLKYTLSRQQYPVHTRSGPAVREVVELERFVMIPTEEELGEPLTDALQPDSQLLRRLDQWDADETIITVWTYPDSYSEFRQLKAALYERGFLTAARPLPDGQPISGSPQGTRSAAQ